jgi:photosystem II stability/assembly factor-like uncharacterized protein
MRGCRLNFYCRITTAKHPQFAICSVVALALIFSCVATQPSAYSTSVVQDRLFTPHDEFYSVHINPSGSGWVVGNFGTILRSVDAGNRWTRQNSGTLKPLTSVSFTDERHGFVVGGGGTIMTTTDGGKSWRMRESGTKDHLLEVHALSSSQAFVSGAFGTLLSTRDGGASWQKHSLPWPRELVRQVF